MTATVHVLHSHPVEIGHFIRLGHTGHRILETLHAAGRLPISRAVVDAAHLEEQDELLDTLRGSGVELVLDTKEAELATPGGYEGRARRLPWAHPERHHTPSDFDAGGRREFAKQIAVFAVANGVDAVLTPTRLLEGARDPWQPLNLKACEELRRALDMEGGRDVAVDYPLLVTYEAMRDEAVRRAFARALEDTPFENLWLRVSGFGAAATAAGVRRYINGARDFHELGKPIVADGVGGLAGLATVAFGAVGGLSHGIAEKERFDARNWRKPRPQGGGGSGRRVYIPGIDTCLSVEQTRELFVGRGAKALLACNDTSCCPRGVEDMLKAPQAHFLNQRTHQIAELSRVPESRRADHYLRRQLGPAGSAARRAERLNLADTRLAEKLRQLSRRLDEMHQVLEDLVETDDGSASCALAPRRRAAGGRAAAVRRR